jgi:DNA-binding response OmpR family regulator
MALPYKLLVVDDEKTSRVLVISVAMALGFDNIREAEDGVQALAAVEEEQPDFLVLDLQMPNKDGMEVLQDLSRQHRLEDMGVMMLTATNEERYIQDAIMLGADDYLAKPIDINELQDRLKEMVDENQPS